RCNEFVKQFPPETESNSRQASCIHRRHFKNTSLARIRLVHLQASLPPSWGAERGLALAPLVALQARKQRSLLSQCFHPQHLKKAPHQQRKPPQLLLLPVQVR